MFLRTRQIVREDAVQLFGFAAAEELELFDLMIAVSGVGPRLALAVLSGLRPQALRARHPRGAGGAAHQRARHRQEDRRAAGGGVARQARGAPRAGGAEPAREGGLLPRSERWNDAVAALTRLGYTAAQAQEAVRRAAGAEEDPSLEQLVRRALALLGRPATPGKERP